MSEGSEIDKLRKKNKNLRIDRAALITIIAGSFVYFSQPEKQEEHYANEEQVVALFESNLPEGKQELLLTIQRLFSNAGVHFDIRIGFNEEKPNSRALYEDQVIEIYHRRMELDDFELETSATHESFHMLHSQLLMDRQNILYPNIFFAMRNYENLYKNFSEMEIERIYNNGQETGVELNREDILSQYGEDSIFYIFDESHYHCREGELRFCVGHPYKNDEEFFASMMTIMRMYPQEFIQEFNTFMNRDLALNRPSVSLEQVEMARQLVLATIDAFEVSLDRDREQITSLVPRFYEIKEAIE